MVFCNTHPQDGLLIKVRRKYSAVFKTHKPQTMFKAAGGIYETIVLCTYGPSRLRHSTESDRVTHFTVFFENLYFLVYNRRKKCIKTYFLVP